MFTQKNELISEYYLHELHAL